MSKKIPKIEWNHLDWDNMEIIDSGYDMNTGRVFIKFKEIKRLKGGF
jgi:hypothetical protein